MLAPQKFQLTDLGVVAFLVVLEAMLSADNALVLALMVKHLPEATQRKALTYGLVGAFVFRFIAILIAASLINLWWLQAIGAAYLLFLFCKRFFTSSDEDSEVVARSFWKTVLMVELTDVAFAVDSVLAAVSAVGDDPSKVWVIYFGAIIGVVLLRFAASSLTKTMTRFPALEGVAYAIVGWAGVKLAFLAAHHGCKILTPDRVFPYLPSSIFWTGVVLIAGTGTFFATRRSLVSHQ